MQQHGQLVIQLVLEWLSSHPLVLAALVVLIVGTVVLEIFLAWWRPPREEQEAQPARFTRRRVRDLFAYVASLTRRE